MLPFLPRIVVAAIFLTLSVLPHDAMSQVQTKEQQGCSTAVDKGFSKTVKAVGKEMCSCIKDISKSKASGATCFGTDRKGKVAQSMAKAEASHADACLGNDPDFGFAGAGPANRTAQAADTGLVKVLFGDDLLTALPIGAPDPVLSKCQQSVAKAVKKCHDARVKTYAKCKKKALSDGAADQAAVTACVTDDGAGKLDKSCDLDSGGKVDKVRGALVKSCAGVDLAVAFPGCATSDPEALHACVISQEACIACRATSEVAGDLAGTDCDLYDNGADDNSCLVIAWENVAIPSIAEPAETPGTAGVVVTNPKLIEQFGGASIDLNTAMYTRWRFGGPEQTPDAVFVVIAGFGGDSNNFKIMVEDLLPKMLADHGMVIEVWGFHRRSNQLEDRVGYHLANAAGDEAAAIDWYYGDDMGIPLSPLLAAGPNRRAIFYNSSDDIPFLANWTTQVVSQDLDVVVEAARATATNNNVFLGGHSAGTGFTARYAATDFDLGGGGPAEPGYAKLRGLVLFEGGGGSTLGDPLTADSVERIIAKADGGLFGAVRDDAARCVDGTTACTIATEAADCVGQVPAKCTPPVSAYTAISGLGPEINAAAEPGAVQAVTDPDSGLHIAQTDFAGPDTSPVDLVPGLAVLGFLPDSTVSGLFGQFLDDDEIGSTFSPALGTGIGKLGIGSPVDWRDITEGPLPASATPDNGPMPTSLPADRWGVEQETVRMDRYLQTFTAAESNAADWYYAGSGYSVTTAAGVCTASVCTAGNVGAGCSASSDCAQSISLDSSAVSVGAGRRDIVNLVEAANIDIPVISFGGSNGLTPVGASYLGFAKSIGTCAAPSCDGTPRVVDELLPNPAFPTYGSVEGGYEVYIREGLSHQDVVVAEDVPSVDILGPLAAFIARNTQ